jgi:hypothetical protein
LGDRRSRVAEGDCGIDGGFDAFPGFLEGDSFPVEGGLLSDEGEQKEWEGGEEFDGGGILR